MKPTVCRLCKHAHWRHQPHVWDELPDDLPAWPDTKRLDPFTVEEMLNAPPAAPETPRKSDLELYRDARAEVERQGVQMTRHRETAPKAPRSNARSSSRRRQDTVISAASPSRTPTATAQTLSASPDRSDTAPSADELGVITSVITREALRVITDAELTQCYNAVMAEVMRRRRAKITSSGR
jgi:hypothetical protein